MKRGVRLRLIPMALLFALLPAFGIRAEEKSSKKVEKLPNRVQATIERESKGAEIVGTQVEKKHGKKLYELRTRVNGRGRDLLIYSTGRVVEIEEELDMTRLPDAVRSSIRKHTAGGKVIKIESIAKADKRVYAYAVQADMNGKDKSFRLSRRGKLLRD